jgi:hypothetical protein
MIGNVKRRMIVRTQYTLKSMALSRARPYRALNKARGRNLSTMFSRAGTVSRYLWMQEGATKKGIGGPVPIPRLITRGGKSIRGIVRPAYRLKKSQRLTIGEQGDDGRRFVGVPRGGNRPLGLYERSGNNKRLAMLRLLTHDEVKIKDTDFHDDAVRRYGARQFIAAQFRRIAQRELNRGR